MDARGSTRINSRLHAHRPKVAAWACGAWLCGLAVGGCPAPQEACTNDNHCGNDVCVSDVCAPGCSPDAPCPDGSACIDDGDGVGGCLPVTEARGVSERCSNDRQCQSGACEGDVCVDICTLAAACAKNSERCILAGVRRVCVAPLDDRPAGDPCDDARECLSGTCARAAPGAASQCAQSCSAAVPCGGEQVCLRLEGGGGGCFDGIADGTPCASSELCVGGLCIEDRDGAVCASQCDAGQCADDFVCVEDDAARSVCMPVLDDRPAGIACSDARECADRNCIHFIVNEDTDLGFLCAEPCPSTDPGACGPERVCWEGDISVCGPAP